MRIVTANPTHREMPIISPQVDSEQRGGKRAGTALCLSGGGYRAMLFHAGTLWRLNDAGLLKKLNRVSSVSGGSISAAVLGLKWSSLDWQRGTGVALNFEQEVIAAIVRLAGVTIDKKSILKGILSKRDSVAERVAKAYRERLFGDATLQDLPDKPRFVINATNVQTGVLWRFSKPYMGDYKVGRIPHPRFPLAMAVAASSAFPPVLSPLAIKLDTRQFKLDRDAPLRKPPFTTKVYLSDGGVYDNLGIETAWKRYQTVLVSDAGGRPDPDPTPKSNWASHSLRVFSIINSQVRSLRKRQVVSSYEAGVREGSYWGIWTPIGDYGVSRPLPAPAEQTRALAETPTRLKSLPVSLRRRLINWGYAACDASIRRYYDSGLAAPARFPYPDEGVG
jgi:NTE family protein